MGFWVSGFVAVDLYCDIAATPLKPATGTSRPVILAVVLLPRPIACSTVKSHVQCNDINDTHGQGSKEVSLKSGLSGPQNLISGSGMRWHSSFISAFGAWRYCKMFSGIAGRLAVCCPNQFGVLSLSYITVNSKSKAFFELLRRMQLMSDMCPCPEARGFVTKSTKDAIG